ncbi:helix-turn-helix domain-containing protein, partial [Burkholderia gladioli]
MPARNIPTHEPGNGLRSADVARRFDVQPCTVLRWQRKGLLPSTRDARGFHLFDAVAVETFDPEAHRNPPGRTGRRGALLTTTEAAAMLSRSPSFVRGHADVGDLPFTWSPSGVRLFERSDVRAFQTTDNNVVARAARAERHGEQQRVLQDRRNEAATLRAKGWLTTREAAQRLGLSGVRVAQLAADGSLSGKHVGWRWYIEPEAVVRLIEQRKNGEVM